MDRGGNFIDHLITMNRQSAALMLVQIDPAKVHDSAYSVSNCKQLLGALGFSELTDQAHEYEMTYVRLPPNEDDRKDANTAIVVEIGNDECLRKTEYRENNIEYILPYHASTKENVVQNLAERDLIAVELGRGRRQKSSKLLYDQLEQA